MVDRLNLSSVMPEKRRSVKKRDFDFTSLGPVKGANRRRKRIGRGHGSGWGKTSGRGEKGQKSRTGYSHKAGFEGGQNPLYKRIPKRGFTNIFKQEFQIVNLWLLAKHNISGEVSLESLKEKSLIQKLNVPVKLLGHGDLTSKVVITVHAASKSAIDKVKKAGGEVKIIGSKS